MSDKSSQRHAKRMADKRKAKAAKADLYTSLRGTSKKRKKQNITHSKLLRMFNRFTPGKHQHQMANCGNTGCPKCGVTWKKPKMTSPVNSSPTNTKSSTRFTQTKTTRRYKRRLSKMLGRTTFA